LIIDTIAELICREKACDMQYCMLLQKRANSNLVEKPK
jgi:hypothetical protein